MPRTKPVAFALLAVLVRSGAPEATTYIPLGLHERVQHSDTIVLARVVDPARALLSVERVLKGDPPKQLTLISYVDPWAAPEHHKALVLDSRELLFLRRKGETYAPVQDQFGRLTVDGGRLIDSFSSQPLSLSQTLASIERLVALQARAAGGDAEADAAYVAALRNDDAEVQMWALWRAKDRVKVPSPVLADALLARWPAQIGPVLGSWNAAGLVANTVVVWRLQGAAPFFARILSTSNNANERAWAAMALGGTGDRTYLPVLRRVAADDADPQARALAYNGIMWMLGPDSLPDLRSGAQDVHSQVRARVVVDAYNLLELGRPESRWPPASSALIAEVREFLTGMLSDPAQFVSTNARSMLAMIAKNRPER